ncbi:MAG: hypothetical protein ACREJ2_17960, partial [Planctomycetota bacterium]
AGRAGRAGRGARGAKLAPRQPTAAVTRPFVKAFAGLDWYILADRWPDPRLYLSVRGGTTEVPHGHMDLTSFHCVVGGEALINTISAAEYLDTTFSPRRYELFEMTPPAKNAVLINGVGHGRPARVKSRALAVQGFPAVRIDGTAAMTQSRDGQPVGSFYGRLFVLFGAAGVVVIDRVKLFHFARAETRLQSLARWRVEKETAVVRGRRESLAAAFAASVPAVLQTALPALTTPGHSLNTLRWCSRSLHEALTFVTLLTPGRTPGRVTVEESRAGLAVTVRIGRFSRRLRLNDRLLPR